MTRFFVLLSVVLLLAGCGRDGAAHPQDRADRASESYARAMEHLTAGHIEAAVKGFEKVIREDPGNANARFQLATIYAEKSTDLIGAIANYRAFAIMRPDSDRATLARDRARRCEALYAADAAARSGALTSLSNALDILRREHAGCLARIAAAEAKCAAADERARKAETAVIMKDRVIAGMADDPDPVRKPEKIRPTDAELLDEEDDGTRIRKDDVAKLRAELDAEEAGDAGSVYAKKTVAPSNAVPFLVEKPKKALPAHPSHYTVQEGDTLMRLAIRFYGQKSAWRRIQAANRAIISTDGRIRAGQTIVLPE